MEKNLTPKIRFRGFTEPWDLLRLNDCGTTFPSLSGKSKEDFGHGDGKYITYMNVFTNPIAQLDGVERIEIDNSQTEIQNGDIFFTTSSETPDEVGMSSVWLGDEKNIYLNSFCFGYRPSLKFDSIYMAHFLRSDFFRKQITFLAQGISRFNISKTKVMELLLALPKEEQEQRIIGQFFLDVDEAISSKREELEKLENVKQACMERMFPREGETTPQLRFKGFTDDWKIIQLQKIASRVTTKNTNKVVEEVFTNSAEYGIVSQKEYFDHDIAKKNNIGGYYIVNPNNFVYNPRVSSQAPYGPINRNKTNRVGVVSPLYSVFSINDIDPSFLEVYFKTTLWHNFMLQNGDNGARHDRFSIGSELFFEMPVSIPSTEEQEKIANYFRHLDELIAAKHQEIEKLKDIKQSLLDKMFV